MPLSHSAPSLYALPRGTRDIRLAGSSGQTSTALSRLWSARTQLDVYGVPRTPLSVSPRSCIYNRAENTSALRTEVSSTLSKLSGLCSLYSLPYLSTKITIIRIGIAISVRRIFFYRQKLQAKGGLSFLPLLPPLRIA